MSAKNFFTQFYKKHNFAAPKMHVVLGSGLASLLKHSIDENNWEEITSLSFSDVPQLPISKVEGHGNCYHYLKHKPSGNTLCIQEGRLHGYEGLPAREVVKTVLWPALAGTKYFLLNNAAGSLNPKLKPGSVMVLSDHINLTGDNPLKGDNPSDEGKAIGPRFPDMSHAYSEVHQDKLVTAFKASGVDCEQGVYLGLMGPSFETPAEIKLFHQWGIDAVGMSTVWESIALNHCGATVNAFSFISNQAAGISPTPLTHEEVQECASQFGPKVFSALMNFCDEVLSS